MSEHDINGARLPRGAAFIQRDDKHRGLIIYRPEKSETFWRQDSAFSVKYIRLAVGLESKAIRMFLRVRSSAQDQISVMHNFVKTST